MELSVYERMTLLQVLPVVHRESSFIKLKTLNGLLEQVGFDEHELTDWEIVQDGERITWNHTKAEDKDIEMGPVATAMALDALEWLDRNEKLNMGVMDLCAKFGYEGIEEEE
jgi:hypothetical protein